MEKQVTIVQNALMEDFYIMELACRFAPRHSLIMLQMANVKVIIAHI